MSVKSDILISTWPQRGLGGAGSRPWRHEGVKRTAWRGQTEDHSSNMEQKRRRGQAAGTWSADEVEAEGAGE